LKNGHEKNTQGNNEAKTANFPEMTSTENSSKPSAQPAVQGQNAPGTQTNVPVAKAGQSVPTGQNLGGGNSHLGEAAKLTSSLRPSAVEGSSIAQRIDQIQQLLSKANGSILKLAKGGGGRMTLRLDPPALGRLQIEVEIMRDVCNARVLTDDPTAKASLMQGLPQLREALETQGLKLEGFTVDDHETSSSFSQSAAQQRNNGHGAGHESRLAADNSEKEVRSDTRGVNPRPVLGVVDLHV
jgi:flagellar hook-length control protein FliK